MKNVILGVLNPILSVFKFILIISVPALAACTASDFSGFLNNNSINIENVSIDDLTDISSGHISGTLDELPSNAKIQYSYDGGSVSEVEITSKDFKIPIPVQVDGTGWKLNSSHTVLIRVVDSLGEVIAQFSHSFTRKMNFDYNGDGFDDIAVNATCDNGTNPYGPGKCVIIYFGSSNGLETGSDKKQYAQRIFYPGADTGSWFATSFANLGDVNGDGYGDLALSDASSDIPGTDRGIVLIYYGSENGLTNGTGDVSNTDGSFGSKYDQMLKYPGADDGAWFGYYISALGDVNGDGYADLAVGAPSSDIEATGNGAVFIYYGSANGLSGGTGDVANTDAQDGKAYDHRLFYPDVDTNAFFGASIRSVGDINKDGYSDFVASAYNSDVNGSNNGAVYVYLGSAQGLSSGTGDVANTDGLNGKKYSQRLLYPGADSAAKFGDKAGGGGDLNGDGYSDIVIGASSADTEFTDQGAFYVYFGSSSGVAGGTGDVANTDTTNGKKYSQRILYPFLDDNTTFGGRFSTGDLNGDGFEDLVSSSRTSDNFETGQGALFIYYGSSSGLSDGTGDVANTDGQNGKTYSDIWGYYAAEAVNFGFTASSLFDVNRDGYKDVIVGVSGSDLDGSNMGNIFLQYGSASGVDTGADKKSYSNHIKAPSVVTGGLGGNLAY